MPSTKRPSTKLSSARKSAPARNTAPARHTAPARSARSAAPARSSARKPAARSRKSTGGALIAGHRPWIWSSLSTDRKLDIVGIILALIGLLTLLSLLSTTQGEVTGVWIQLIHSIAGWGSVILPVVLMLVGIWLVLRNVERLPMLSAERTIGMILLYLNVLSWMHLIGGAGMDLTGQQALAARGGGGGYIGLFFEAFTVGALGEVGAFITFSAWLLVAIALTLDISVSEMFRFIQRILASLARRINERLAVEQQLKLERQAQLSANQAALIEDGAYRVPNLDDPDGLQNASHELPPDFKTIGGANGAPSGQSNGMGAPANGAVPRSRPARAGAGDSAQSPAAQRAAEDAAALTQPGAKAQPNVKLGGQSLPPWKRPAIGDVLEASAADGNQINKEEEDRRSALIVETLASFGAPVRVVQVSTGPTVTQFGVEPLYVENRNGRVRVRVSKIVALADDLALALAAPRIRIQAPVPGRNYVGIEVPNTEISRVLLRDVMEAEAFKKLSKSPLRFALGKDVSGHSKAYDLAGMPHLLIAGTTGSGKSVCVNSILTCLLINNTPNELRMILVDPKRVELTGYNGIPHLLAPVIVEAEQVVGALQWVQREMDARYHRFSQVGARNIVDYNARNQPPLPYMLVLIDELADLMMLAPDETERSLTRLAQLARATGIHLVLATQRPSVDVVTGLIKANFPARVAFAVASGTDSRVILDQPGAERLLGRGDMLFQAPDAAAPVRLQGVYVSDAEIQDLVEYWREQAFQMRDVNIHAPTATPVNMDMPVNAPLRQGPLFGDGDGASGGDPIMSEAIKIVRDEGKASISMLQRKLRIGYTRAARLVDSLEEQGIIGPAQATSQVREVLDFGDSNNAEAKNNLDGG